MSVEKYTGVYADLAEILGEEAVLVLFKNMAGQQVTFPKRLYNREYVVEETKNLTDSGDIKKAAIQYGYTERRLKQLLKFEKEKST